MQLTIKRIVFCCWLSVGLFSMLTAQSGVLDDIKDQNIDPQGSFEIINVTDFILPTVTCGEVTLSSNRAVGTDTRPDQSTACANVKPIPDHSNMTVNCTFKYGNVETFEHPDDFLILYNEINEVVVCGGYADLTSNDIVLNENVYKFTINGSAAKYPVRMDFYSGKDKKLYQVDSVFQYVQNVRMGKTGAPYVIDLAPLALSFVEGTTSIQATVLDTTFVGTICYTIDVSDCSNGQTGTDQVCFSVGVPAQDCEESHTLTSELFTSSTYRAVTTIEASNIIQTTADVSYFAGESITLKPGFEVKAGGKFLAKIETCTAANLSQIETAKATLQDENLTPLFTETLEEVSTFKLNLFPNPVNQRLTVHYYLSKAEHVKLWLLDANGKIIQHTQATASSIGWQETNLQTSHLPAGIYFLSMQTAQQHIHRKVFVQR